MEKIAFISGGTFIYWSSIILALAVVVAITMYAALYLAKGGKVTALSISIPLSLLLSIVLSRLVHWYCRDDAYESMRAAMTDYSWGGYALMGAFAACIVVACVLRLVRIHRNLPQMLDCMAIGGGAGIAVGRLASLFNSSDRGIVLPDYVGLPFAYPVTNAVSGAVENRLATFMLQSIFTGAIVILLLLYMGVCTLRKKKIRDGDVCLIFLLAYGAGQVVFDSTRYDSLFLRSNGFISIVQILGAAAIVLAIVVFSVRMVQARKLKVWFFAMWIVLLGLIGGAGYMEYHVQRHGNEAAFAYSVMGSCLALVVIITLVIRALGLHPVKKAAHQEPESEVLPGGSEPEQPAEETEQVEEVPVSV